MAREMCSCFQTITDLLEQQHQQRELMAAGTFTIVGSVPPDSNIVSATWLNKQKADTQGMIAEEESRVARGFSQVLGVDHFETFFPTASAASIKLIVAAFLAVKNDWDLKCFAI